MDEFIDEEVVDEPIVDSWESMTDLMATTKAEIEASGVPQLAQLYQMAEKYVYEVWQHDIMKTVGAVSIDTGRDEVSLNRWKLNQLVNRMYDLQRTARRMRNAKRNRGGF